jgi:hypothetical protein
VTVRESVSRHSVPDDGCNTGIRQRGMELMYSDSVATGSLASLKAAA